MNAMTTRDKWIAAALPALVTILLGWFILLRPLSSRANLLRQRVQNQGPLSEKQALLTAASAESVELEKSIAAKRSTAGVQGSRFDRNRAMQEVSLLSATNGLRLDAAAMEPGGKLPPLLQEAIPAVSREGTTPQVWRIELSGSYPGMMGMLDGLEKAGPLIVPLSLAMETGKNERQPARWVLTLWL